MRDQSLRYRYALWTLDIEHDRASESTTDTLKRFFFVKKLLERFFCVLAACGASTTSQLIWEPRYYRHCWIALPTMGRICEKRALTVARGEKEYVRRMMDDPEALKVTAIDGWDLEANFEGCHDSPNGYKKDLSSTDLWLFRHLIPQNHIRKECLQSKLAKFNWFAHPFT